jgi:alanine dehydrogenase
MTQALEDELPSADVVISAVLVSGASAPRLVSRQALRRLKRGAVLVDVAIDRRSCFETSRPTTHAQPSYEVDGVIYYCVANMSGAVPLTSSYALNNATLPFGLALAGQGLAALVANPNLLSGLNVHCGKLTNQAVAESLGLPFTEARDALSH